MAMRVVFMGTPDFAVPTLTALREAGHDIAAVYTRPPQPAGRGLGERMSPVHVAARNLELPLVMPKTLRLPAAEDLFRSHRADCAVVVAFGAILPASILDAPRLGCFNVHASLLPRWRGAAPIERAILEGDRRTGITIMRMAEALDSGPICLVEDVAIGKADTAGDLVGRLAQLGAGSMVKSLAALESGALDCRPQGESGVTYARKIGNDEARVDWRRSSDEVRRHVNALSPAPGAWCEMAFGGKRERVRLLRAAPAEGAGHPGTILHVEPLVVACGEGAVRFEELQRAGRKPAPAREFARGARLRPGDRLG
jgi:methionyl-tRNA formyltransferase